MKKKKFGELLIEKGLITQKKLDDALFRQRGFKRKLGETLVMLEHLSEEQLAKILGDLAGVPAVDLSKFTLEKDASKYVDAQFCAKHRLIPIAIKNYNKRDHLVVAFADPMNLEIIDELRFIVDIPIFRVAATSSSIKAAIIKTYPTVTPASTIPGEIPMTMKQSQAGTPALRDEPSTDKDLEQLSLELLSLRKTVQILLDALSSKQILSREQAEYLKQQLNT